MLFPDLLLRSSLPHFAIKLYGFQIDIFFAVVSTDSMLLGFSLDVYDFILFIYKLKNFPTIYMFKIKFLKIIEFQESYFDRDRITKSLDLIILKNFLEKFKKFRKLTNFFKYLRIKNKFLKFFSFLFNISRLYLFK